MESMSTATLFLSLTLVIAMRATFILECQGGIRSTFAFTNRGGYLGQGGLMGRMLTFNIFP